MESGKSIRSSSRSCDPRVHAVETNTILIVRWLRCGLLRCDFAWLSEVTLTAGLQRLKIDRLVKTKIGRSRGADTSCPLGPGFWNILNKAAFPWKGRLLCQLCS